jgi:hypothetical protein
MKDIKFIVSEEDTEILKAIMDCDPRFDTEETMTVVTLEPIKKLLKEQRERIIEELTGCFTDRQFVFTLPQDGFGELMEVKILDFGGVNAYARIENGIERVNDIIINKLKQ